ncbi:MAG TPA: hypothetical protein VGM68_00440 [Rhizomicrobium sp.]
MADPVADTPLQILLGGLDRALKTVEGLQEASRFRRALVAAPTIAEQYLAICRLGYAADSKELRDTADPQIHAALDRLSNTVRAIDRIVLFRLAAVDAAQQKVWQALCEAADASMLLHDNGVIHCLLLGADIADDTFRVRRVWNSLSNSDGKDVDLILPLHRSQIGALRPRLALVRGEAPYRFGG